MLCCHKDMLILIKETGKDAELRENAVAMSVRLVGWIDEQPGISNIWANPIKSET